MYISISRMEKVGGEGKRDAGIGTPASSFQPLLPVVVFLVESPVPGGKCSTSRCRFPLHPVKCSFGAEVPCGVIRGTD